VTSVTTFIRYLGKNCATLYNTMSPQSPKELLASLRANLKHFDKSPGIGHATDAAQIRQKLLKRIADVERIVRLVAVGR